MALTIHAKRCLGEHPYLPLPCLRREACERYRQRQSGYIKTPAVYWLCITQPDGFIGHAAATNTMTERAPPSE